MVLSKMNDASSITVPIFGFSGPIVKPFSGVLKILVALRKDSIARRRLFVFVRKPSGNIPIKMSRTLKKIDVFANAPMLKIFMPNDDHVYH